MDNNEMKFYSRKDTWLSIIVWITILICAGTSVLPLLDEETDLIGGLIFLIIMLGSAAFMVWLWTSTYYRIERQDLLVHSGPIRKRIPLSSITKVKPVVSIISSAALSVHRLEVRYGKHGLIYISPERQKEFLDLLHKKCPKAKFETNARKR